MFDGKILLLHLPNPTACPLLRRDEGLFLLKPNVKLDDSIFFNPVAGVDVASSRQC